MDQQPQRFLRKIRRSEVLNIETSHSSAVIQVPRPDAELPHTEKFGSSLLSQIPTLAANFFGIRNDIESWRSIKEIPAIPTYMDMSDESRTRLLHVIYAMGNSPSAVVARIVGLTARQVGAIRRWNIPGWKTLTNRHVNNACNFDRLLVKR
jgi:hypothetical protein